LGYRALVDLMYYERGDVQGAEKLARSFVDKYPYHQEAYELLFELMAWYKGDFSAALAVLDEAMARNPDRVWPHLLLAEAHAYQFDEHASPEVALAALQKALELRPRSGQVLRQAGDLYGTLGDTRKAIRYFQLALEVSPGSSSILAELANTLLNRAQFDSAATVAADALNQAPGRLEMWQWDPYDVLEDALVMQLRADEYLDILQDSSERYGQDNPFFYVEVGRNQCLLGQYQEAMASCNQVLRILEQDSLARAQETLRSLRWLGMAQWFAGDTDAALKSFRRGNVTEDNWDKIEMGRRLISLLKYLGRFDEVDDLIDGLHEDGMMTAWVRHACYYYPSMRNFDKVLSVIDEALESEEITWKTDLRLLQVSTYRQLGSFEKAEALLREIEPSPTLGTVGPERELEWAALEATRGKLEHALQLAESAYEARITEYRRNIYIPLLSKLYYALGREQDAINVLADANGYFSYVECFYRRAQIAVAAGSPDADNELHKIQFLAEYASRGDYLRLSLGLASIYSALAAGRLGDPERARSEIEYAIKLEPERADIAYGAACGYALVGETEKAFDWLQTAVERGHQELWWALVDPDLDPLRELLRFKEIMDEWDHRIEALVQ
jgi:tetratricopeptide (TPR) repeat protein